MHWEIKAPAEHGAWGIVIVPFLCAAALAGGEIRPLLLAGICVLGLFVLRAQKTLSAGTSTLIAVVASSGLFLMVGYQRYSLLTLGAVALVLYLMQTWQMSREKRNLAAELLGVVLLTMSALAAWVSARGSLDPRGLQIWILNLLFFMGGVLTVKYRVLGIRERESLQSLPDRVSFAWPVLLYHALLLIFLVVVLPAPLVLLAFTPGILRAAALLRQLGQRFAIKSLGWTEVAHSILFAVLLIVGLHLGR